MKNEERRMKEKQEYVAKIAAALFALPPLDEIFDIEKLKKWAKNMPMQPLPKLNTEHCQLKTPV